MLGMSERPRTIEEVRMAAREPGRNFFERDLKSDSFRIPGFGDALDPYNSDFSQAEEDGLMEVERDKDGLPLNVLLTPKYFAEKAELAQKGAVNTAIHMRKMAERYYGRRRANPESIAMDKEENFDKFLQDWLDEEEFVRGWSLRKLKQKNVSSFTPSQYRLEVEFEDDRKPVVFIGEPENIVARVDLKLRQFYPRVADEYV